MSIEKNRIRSSVTYILPTTSWCVLLDAIVRDAPLGSTIEVHTESMRVLAEQALADYHRLDMSVYHRQDPMLAADGTA